MTCIDLTNRTKAVQQGKNFDQQGASPDGAVDTGNTKAQLAALCKARLRPATALPIGNI